MRKLRTASRLVNLIAVFCILSWRIFFITMVNRSAPSMSAKSAFTGVEIALDFELIELVPQERLTLNECVPLRCISIARERVHLVLGVGDAGLDLASGGLGGW